MRPVLEENIKFEFWESCLDELQRYKFAGEDNEEAHEHVSIFSETIDLFQAPNVSRDVVMRMAFPSLLKGKALKWIKKLLQGTIATWDSLKKDFLKEYRTPRKILQQLEKIRKFQQDQGETLFSAWERFEDLLFKCPEHKLNKHEQLQIFYNGLNIETRRILDFKEPIPKMTAARGLEKIDEIARYSSTWHAKQEPIPYEPDELGSILKNIKKVKSDMNSLTVEVNMVQHSFDDPINGKVTDLERVIKKFIKDSYQNQRKNQETIWGIKMEFDGVLKSQVNAIRKLEAQVGNLAKTIKDRSSGDLPSTTETNPRDLAPAITTRSGLNYKEPAYPIMTDNEKTTSSNDKSTLEQLHSIISEGEGESESPVPLEGNELHETAKGAESIPKLKLWPKRDV
ncbi:hypothetical protein CTI12_AA580870 [Artemisia annua]|uniref:Retrotransposon gag domain-containing protein n=1 Tax=Artemisia annua TaxID=35608 RepID=A0A2U1KKN7_ARTAN|nr:hypothetical protein CTI12_AA580870 [Artemisia annua]